MMFLDTLLGETDFENVPDYIHEFLADHDAMLERKLPESRRILNALPASTSSILEVGMGVGALAQAANELGYQYHAIEPSHSLADALIDRKIVSDTQVTRLPLQHATLTSMSYDAVVMIMVLEHLMDPVAALQQCIQALRPGGTLYIEVPNSRMFAGRTRLRRLLSMSDFVHGHVNFFVPSTLALACHSAGAVTADTRLVSLFQRDDVQNTAHLNPAAATPLRMLNAFFSRVPVDEWFGIASVLCCVARRGVEPASCDVLVTEIEKPVTGGDQA